MIVHIAFAFAFVLAIRYMFSRVAPDQLPFSIFLFRAMNLALANAMRFFSPMK